MKKSIFGRLGRKEREQKVSRKHRPLRIDPLEERQLLSVSPGNVTDGLVNQSYVPVSSTGPWHGLHPFSDGGTIGSQSIAVDNDGDFVVTWGRQDPLLDPDTGLQMIDDETGEPMFESNIYARYFTDEVQRVTLPAAIAENNVSGSYGRFSLVYGGDSIVQRLSISATYEPYTFFQDPIAGQFVLQADANVDGTVGPGETATIIYDETDAPQDIAATLQSALQGIGGALQNAQVTAVSGRDFVIEYGDPEVGLNQPKLSIGSANWTSGFYPAATISTVRAPTEIANIPVSPDNPAATANAIQLAFAQAQKSYPAAPFDFPPPDRVPSISEGPYQEPITIRTEIPKVSVTAVSATQFDIRFIDESGKKDHPLLQVSSARDDFGNTLLPSTDVNVKTLKEPSPEFRVNPDEPDDPLTPGPDQLDQKNPAVAIDADGDFVIVWESEVSDFETSGSVSDIFARRYMPVGTIDVGPNDIPGVSPVPVPDTDGSYRVDEFTFRVNDDTTNPQFEPAVAMDDAGNFVIAWANGGQDFSFFNGIKAQQYNRHGERLGTEFDVNTEETAVQYEPAVGMGPDGHFVIAWARTHDIDYLRYRQGLGGVWTSTINAAAFDADGQVVLPQFNVGGAGGPTIAFDTGNRFVIAWDELSDNDFTGLTTTSVHATMYELLDATGAPSGAVLRDEFRLNSASQDPGTTPMWPWFQGNPSVGLDADGDLFGVFEGYGPDTSTDIWIAGTWLRDQLNMSTNSDLLSYFDPASEDLVEFFYSNGDVDGTIEYFLIRADNRGASAEQLGRLRAILDSVGGLMRGEAYGILSSRFDADPQMEITNLYSDSVINNYRDGHNQRYLFLLDSTVNWESFTLRLTRAGVPGWEDLTIDNIQVNNTFSPFLALERIDEVLEGATRTGDAWPEDVYEGPIDVRLISLAEMLDRQGTPWEVRDDFGLAVDPFDYYVYEVTFQGASHDDYFGVFPLSPAQADGEDVAPPNVVEYMQASPGTIQVDASLGVMPDGSFTVAWTQWNESTTGVVTNKSIYFRQFKESTDTAGPIVTDLVAPDGTRVDPDDVVVTEDGLQHLVVTFDEEMLAFDQETLEWALAERDEALANSLPIPSDVKRVLDSVTNPENYRLSRNGVFMEGSIVKIEFGMSKAAELSDELGLNPTPTNKWEAVLYVDADAGEPGLQPLPDDMYSLEVLAPIEAASPGEVGQSGVRDKAGNPLGRTGYVPDGEAFTRDFRVLVGEPGPAVPGEPGEGDVDDTVNTTLEGDQTDVAVAMNASGAYVAVWASPDPTTGETNILGQQYNREGEPVGPEFTVNAYDTGDQVQPAVAMDDLGNFVVVWGGEGEDDLDDGIFARRFNRFGVPQGEEFRVNQFRVSLQEMPQVAMDADGDFVVTWTSTGQSEDPDGVYARRYNRFGQAQGDEFRLNSTIVGRQQNSDVAMDDDGNFVAVWQSFNQDGSDYSVIRRVFNADGTPRTGEMGVNQYVNDKQLDPRVAMDADGDFVVTWSSFEQDGNGYGVYARRFGPNGDAKGSEFRVNETTLRWQYQPDVAMDKEGNFTIVWTTMGQDNDLAVDDGIYARMFQADGSDFVLPPKGHEGEFRVNALTEGNQATPAIAMDAVGNYVVGWIGPTADDDPVTAPLNGTDVFMRLLDPPGLVQSDSQATMHLKGTTGDDVFEFVATSDPDTWIVKINGEDQAIVPGMTTVRFDGLSGYDQVKIAGTDGDDIGQLWGNGASLAFGDGFYVEATNVEAADLDGAGGNNSLEVWGSSDNDMLNASPTLVRMYSAGFSHTARGFSTVDAYAGEGVNVASLFDSSGDDTLIGSPEALEMSGDGFRLRAEGYAFAHGYSTAGGNDTAEFSDSIGGDVVNADPAFTVLTGTEYYLRAKGFATVIVDASNGGSDVARLAGSSGNDHLDISPKVADLSGDGYRIVVREVDTITADSAGGSADSVTLTDSPGDDTLVADKNRATFTGADFTQVLIGFEYLSARSTGGEDVALLYDTTGDDVYNSRPGLSVLDGRGYELSVESFRYAHGHATRGGTDVAHMLDSAADDTYVSNPEWAKLYSDTFFTRAKLFDYVHAYSVNGGIDTAILRGSSGNEGVVANSEFIKMMGSDFFQRAKFFDEIIVRGEGGYDTVRVDDGTVVEGTLTRSSDLVPSDAAELAWLIAIDQIEVRNESGSGVHRTIEAADEVFTTFWQD